MQRIQTLIRLMNVQPGEERKVSLMVLVMLLSAAGFTLGSTAIETLFLARYGVEFRPTLYMALSVVSFFVQVGITLLLVRFKREVLYVLLPVLVAALVFGGWWLLDAPQNYVYPFLWLGKEAANALVSAMLWGAAGFITDTRQAKRLFPLFNAGRILGAVLGGFSAGFVVGNFGARSPLLVWGVALVLACLLLIFLIGSPLAQSRSSRRTAVKTSIRTDLELGYKYVLGSPMLRWMAVAASLFSILYFSIDLPFVKTANADFSSESDLAGFLGVFNGLSTAAAFLVTIFLANRIYARIGIMAALLVFALVYSAGFAGLVVISLPVYVYIFRFVQMVYLSGVTDSAYQSMFNAVPSFRRDQVRAFMDGVPSQLGTLAAGVYLLLGQQLLSTQQLAIIGLVFGVIASYVIFRAGQNYHLTLLDSLKAGRQTLFTEQVITKDMITVRAALDGLYSPDRLVRRISVDVLGQTPDPAARAGLVNALQDDDSQVRLSALRGLARPEAASTLLEVAAALKDPDPQVRGQAITTLTSLTTYPRGLAGLFEPLIEDPDLTVRIMAEVALVKLADNRQAREIILQTARQGKSEERALALQGLAELDEPDALKIFSAALTDMRATSSVRKAAALALPSVGEPAIPILLGALESRENIVRDSAAQALAGMGELARNDVIDALFNHKTQEGALYACSLMDLSGSEAQLEQYISIKTESALLYDRYHHIIQPDNDKLALLRDSLYNRARQDAIRAMKGLGLLGDYQTIRTAVENLYSKDPQQVANALETIESSLPAARARPLLKIWEDSQPQEQDGLGQRALLDLLRKDADSWIKACAIYAARPGDPRANLSGKKLSRNIVMDTMTTLSIMDRVIFLRRVSLLADLTPFDLQKVASITTEQFYAGGETIFSQGDDGDEMYVVISGEARVFIPQGKGEPEIELSRQKNGDVFGEMAVISGDKRSATAVAISDIHLLVLDRRSFESLVYERPEVSLAIMRVLSMRIKQMNAELEKAF